MSKSFEWLVGELVDLIGIVSSAQGLESMICLQNLGFRATGHTFRLLTTHLHRNQPAYCLGWRTIFPLIYLLADAVSLTNPAAIVFSEMEHDKRLPRVIA